MVLTHQSLSKDEKNIHLLINEISRAVEKAFQRAIDAFMEQDPGLAAEVIKGDSKINALCMRIEEQCFVTIALRQPVASDLRDLLASLEQWLGPYLENVNSLQDLNKLDLGMILGGFLSWEQQQRLNELAPLRIRVPSGSKLKIDYRETPPVLAVKLQEMFGCTETPTIVNGMVELMLQDCM